MNCSAVNLLETPVPMDGWCALGNAVFAACAWNPICTQNLSDPQCILACPETCTSLSTSAPDRGDCLCLAAQCLAGNVTCICKALINVCMRRRTHKR